MKKSIKSYIIGILIPLGVGALSAFLTRGSMDIYKTLERPALAPPGILFPIVWTVLYFLMGLGSAVIYNSPQSYTKQKNNALIIYALQLAVNFFWSIVFFNYRAFLFSFVLIIALWLLILAMIISFYRINKAAGLLQIPYLLWVTFAGYLNLAVYILNK